MSELISQELVKAKIANRIKIVREKSNISQHQFFCDTKIHIGRIEMGKTNPTIDTLLVISNYFEVSLSDLLIDIDLN